MTFPCVLCHLDTANREGGICLDCVRAERVAQGMPPSLYDNPEAVAWLSRFMAKGTAA